MDFGISSMSNKIVAVAKDIGEAALDYLFGTSEPTNCSGVIYAIPKYDENGDFAGFEVGHADASLNQSVIESHADKDECLVENKEFASLMKTEEEVSPTVLDENKVCALKSKIKKTKPKKESEELTCLEAGLEEMVLPEEEAAPVDLMEMGAKAVVIEAEPAVVVTQLEPVQVELYSSFDFDTFDPSAVFFTSVDFEPSDTTSIKGTEEESYVVEGGSSKALCSSDEKATKGVYTSQGLYLSAMPDKIIELEDSGAGSESPASRVNGQKAGSAHRSAVLSRREEIITQNSKESGAVSGERPIEIQTGHEGEIVKVPKVDSGINVVKKRGSEESPTENVASNTETSEGTSLEDARATAPYGSGAGIAAGAMSGKDISNSTESYAGKRAAVNLQVASAKNSGSSSNEEGGKDDEEKRRQEQRTT